MEKRNIVELDQPIERVRVVQKRSKFLTFCWFVVAVLIYCAGALSGFGGYALAVTYDYALPVMVATPVNSDAAIDIATNNLLNEHAEAAKRIKKPALKDKAG